MKKILIILLLLIAAGAGVCAYADETTKDNSIQEKNIGTSNETGNFNNSNSSVKSNNLNNNNSANLNNNSNSSSSNSLNNNDNGSTISNSSGNKSTSNLDLNNINIASGQDYQALCERAKNICGLVQDINYSIYNAINNKVPNIAYNNLTKEQENIIITGNSEQKAKLINELGGGMLIINTALNDYVPEEMSSIPIHPEYFANGQFYYAFAMTTLSNLCESLNGWRQYYGLISCSGQILNANEINKLIQEHKIYHLNAGYEPKYPVLTFNFNN
ncbi:hypothetical protein [Clostridium mediterraneense]|uniref:hypothetical protein n=1 Tax=Clostridium mediterraneense TaxID=1805472 RepID=UPI0008373EEB|nr:hypothetical protein [Clostridium mediterraneense]